MKALSTRLAALAIDLVRVNRVEAQRQQQVDGFLKTRRPGMGLVIWCGNVFLKFSHSSILMFPRGSDWENHEITSFQRLNPDYRVVRLRPSSIFFQKVPGISLATLAERLALDAPILEAAGREMRRAHLLASPAWSHGDPHMENLLYDAGDQRCRLIDFETAHEAGRPLNWKQADDLLVFLLDLITRPSIPGSQRLIYIRAFWSAYARPELKDDLLARLTVPQPILERILWSTRTHHVSTETLQERLNELRDAL